MIETLERLVDEVNVLQSKLIVLIGSPQSGKSALLDALATKRHGAVLNVGAELGKQLAGLPQRQRPLQTASFLRELAEQHASNNLLLLDNIEILFEHSLQLDPLELLKRYAHAIRVVAVWPGELLDGRLSYAEIGHPEHRDYGLAGLVHFRI